MALGVQPHTADMDRLAARSTSAMPERLLFGREASRTVSCACGGELTAVVGDWEGIAEAVRVHSRSTVHATWAHEQGYR